MPSIVSAQHADEQASRVEETRRLKLLQNAHIEEQLVAWFGEEYSGQSATWTAPFGQPSWRKSEEPSRGSLWGITRRATQFFPVTLPRKFYGERLRRGSGVPHAPDRNGSAEPCLSRRSVDASKAAARSGLSTGLTLERGVNIMGGTDVFRLRRESGVVHAGAWRAGPCEKVAWSLRNSGWCRRTFILPMEVLPRCYAFTGTVWPRTPIFVSWALRVIAS